MAPIQVSRGLPTAILDLLDLLEPRGAAPQSQPAAAIAARFYHAFSSAPISTLPTRTLKTTLDNPSHVRLHARQETTTIPGGYRDIGPDPGTVVGITIGSVGGFLLILWLIYTCLQVNNRNVDTVSSYGTASVVTRRSRGPKPSSSTRPHRRSRRETVEVRTNRGPVIVEEPRERIVVEETRRQSMPPPPPPPQQMPMPAPPPPRAVPQDLDDDDDEVVVIEEHSPPRRHKSKTNHRRSSSARRESGFREVDPDRFAGGNASYRDVRRSSRRISGGR